MLLFNAYFCTTCSLTIYFFHSSVHLILMFFSRLNLEEELDQMKVRVSADKTTIQELNMFLHQEREGSLSSDIPNSGFSWPQFGTLNLVNSCWPVFSFSGLPRFNIVISFLSPWYSFPNPECGYWGPAVRFCWAAVPETDWNTGCQFISMPNLSCWSWSTKPYMTQDQYTLRIAYSHTVLPAPLGHLEGPC